MIVDILTSLSTMLSGHLWVAVLGALFWGIASVVLSPCHLASVPLVMGFVANRSGGTKGRAFVLASIFSLGILLTMVVLGVVAAMLGRMMGDIGGWGKWLGALLFVLLGLFLFDLNPFPAFVLPHQERFKSGGGRAALVLGILFGTVLGPCAFAFMMPVLGVVFSSARTQPLFSVALLVAYAMGHCSVIIIAGTASAAILRVTQASRNARLILYARKGLGVLAFLGAIWFVKP